MKPKLKPLKKFSGSPAPKPVIPEEPVLKKLSGPAPKPELKPLSSPKPGLKKLSPAPKPKLKPLVTSPKPVLKPLSSAALKPKTKPLASPRASPAEGVIIPMSPREREPSRSDLDLEKPSEVSQLKPLKVRGLEGVSVKKLKPLSSDSGDKPKPKKLNLPKLPSEINLESDEKDLDVSDIPALTEAQKGLETADLTNPEAAFQPKPLSKLPTMKLPVAKTSTGLKPLKPPTSQKGLKVLSFETLSEEAEETPQTGEMSILAGKAKLPSQKVRGAPKIKIPKLAASPVRPITPAKSQIAGVSMPKQTTAVSPIAVTSPKPVRTKVVSANIPEQELVENIKKIDTTKLKADRKSKNSYSVVELKAIAGSLNLTKGGSKKDLVERIKSAILRVNPSAVFE